MVLTEDTVFEILLWLPVLSLLRFKSVCKSWYALIQSPLFIDQHLRRTHPLMDNNLLVLDDMPPSQFFQLHSNNHNLELSKQIDLPNFFQGLSVLQIITCNGLVCISYLLRISQHTDSIHIVLYTDSIGIVLWNPAIKQFRDLPQPPLTSEDLQYFGEMGFGFDTTTNDYSVVFFIPEDELSSKLYLVYKYSLIADSWTTKLVLLPNNILCITSNPRAQVTSGTYSWFGVASESSLHESPYYLLSFDFRKEVFEAMPLPNTSTEYPPHFCILKGCISCLNAFELPSDTWIQFEIWVLKEYGVRESWTKLYTVGPFTNIRCPIPIGFSKNAEYLLFGSPGVHKLCLYDIVTHEIKKLLTAVNNSRHYQWAAIYKESLVSLKGGICYL